MINFNLFLVFSFEARSAETPAGTPADQAADQAELERVYDDLFQQMLLDPNNLDLMFRYAAVATRLENYEAAISALERMLLVNPDLPPEPEEEPPEEETKAADARPATAVADRDPESIVQEIMEELEKMADEPVWCRFDVPMGELHVGSLLQPH